MMIRFQKYPINVAAFVLLSILLLQILESLVMLPEKRFGAPYYF